MRFKIWLEGKQFTGITPDNIQWWANYSKHMTFPTPEAARQWVFDRREHADRQPHAAVFGGVDGPEYNRAFADAIPLYQSGKSWKIGKRIRVDRRLRLSDLQIRMPDTAMVHEVAQANGTGEYKILKVKNIPIRYAVSGQDAYSTQQGEINRIRNLAEQIKENKWIEPVIYDASDYSIIEGQHRTRAMKLLGFAMVPGIGIQYLD